jgi:hypothetical protein
MIPVDAKVDNHFKCRQHECPIYWNPVDTLFYLKTRGDWPLQGSNGNSN